MKDIPKDRFQVGAGTFRRLWEQHAPEQWKRSGRPKKTEQSSKLYYHTETVHQLLICKFIGKSVLAAMIATLHLNEIISVKFEIISV